MSNFITPADLAPFADIEATKAAEMIVDAESMAILVAPCLPDLLEPAEGESAADRARREAKVGAVKAILRGALLRWDEAGSGALASTHEMVGPFGLTQAFDTRQTRKAMFWPSEIRQLQDICAEPAKAFSVDTAPTRPVHPPWCSTHFGGACSCGIASGRIYEAP